MIYKVVVCPKCKRFRIASGKVFSCVCGGVFNTDKLEVYKITNNKKVAEAYIKGKL